MSTLRDDLLPVIDDIRKLPGEFGLRRYTVTLRRRVWSGTYAGEGSPTDTDTIVSPTPRVRVLTTEEVASSGGTYREGDFKVDSMTPPYTGGGYSPTTLNLHPAAGTTNQEVVIILTGDEGTIECQPVEFHFDRPFTYWMVLREKRTAVGTTLG
jgi:hypothetical protein